jgi:hypothetical protein
VRGAWRCENCDEEVFEEFCEGGVSGGGGVPSGFWSFGTGRGRGGSVDVDCDDECVVVV